MKNPLAVFHRIFILLTLEFLPIFTKDIVQVSLACHTVLSSVASRTTKENDFLLGHNSNSMTKACLRYVAMDFQILNQRVLFTARLSCDGSWNSFSIIRHFNVGLGGCTTSLTKSYRKARCLRLLTTWSGRTRLLTFNFFDFAGIIRIALHDTLFININKL